MLDFDRIIVLHNKLAQRLKQFEGVTKNSPPREVLNEYRYACRALMEALELQSNPQNDDFKHAEAKAYHALLNAYHDLVDGLNISLIDVLDNLNIKISTQDILILYDKNNKEKIILRILALSGIIIGVIGVLL